MAFTSSNTSLASTFSGTTSTTCDVLEVSADITLPSDLCHQTYINTSALPWNLTGPWSDGATFKTIDAGESVTLSLMPNGMIYIDAQYENVVTGIGSMGIGSTFVIG